VNLKLKLRKLELRGTIIGMILGDGCLSKTTSKSNSRLSLGHSIKQENCLKFKFNRINKLLKIGYNYKKMNRFNKKTNKTYPVIQGNTNVHRYFTKLRKLIYNNEGKKVINRKILNYLTNEGLAYWYMDDGGLHIYNRKDNKGYTRQCFISTQSFTFEEHNIIIDWFKDKYNIECKAYKHGRDKYRITFNATNAKILFSIIEPYILPEFSYKLDLKYSDNPNGIKTINGKLPA